MLVNSFHVAYLQPYWDLLLQCWKLINNHFRYEVDKHRKLDLNAVFSRTLRSGTGGGDVQEMYSSYSLIFNKNKMRKMSSENDKRWSMKYKKEWTTYFKRTDNNTALNKYKAFNRWTHGPVCQSNVLIWKKCMKYGVHIWMLISKL